MVSCLLRVYRSNHIIRVYHAAGTRYHMVQKIVRTSTTTYHPPGTTYTYIFEKSNTAPGTRYTRRVFKPLLLIGSIQMRINWSGVLCFVRNRPSLPWEPPQRRTRYNISYMPYQVCRQIIKRWGVLGRSCYYCCMCCLTCTNMHERTFGRYLIAYSC